MENIDIVCWIEELNFETLSNQDFLRVVSKLNQLQPEESAKIIGQYPILSKRLLISAIEAQGETRIYDVAENEMEFNVERRKEFYDLATKVQADLSKKLDDPTISEKERKAIRKQEIKILKIADKRIRKYEKLRWKWLRLLIKKLHKN